MTRKSKYGFNIWNTLKLILVIACLSLVGLSNFVPPLSPRLKEASSMAVKAFCPSCSCDCPLKSRPIIPLKIDCNIKDQEMYKEIKKGSVSLLREEIALQRQVTNDTFAHKLSQINDTKKASSHYQNEAQKCDLGTLVCETTRERAMAALMEERRLSTLWERRAREYGWTDS